MARRKKTKVSVQREDSSFSDREMLNQERKKYGHIETDRRRYGEKEGAPRRVDGRRAIIYLQDDDLRSIESPQIKTRFAFADPTKVIVCKRRKERRETLFRRNKIGKGKRVSVRRIRDRFSHIKC